MGVESRRVVPWVTLSIRSGNAVQIPGLLGSVVLAWLAGRRGPEGTRLMVASRLLAYFTEHASAHWLVGRLVGIRFTGYGLHGTSHPGSYPPGVRFLFSHLPLLSARVGTRSLAQATPGARAAMYAAGTVATVLASRSRATAGCVAFAERGGFSSGRTCGACPCF